MIMHDMLDSHDSSAERAYQIWIKSLYYQRRKREGLETFSNSVDFSKEVESRDDHHEYI